MYLGIFQDRLSALLAVILAYFLAYVLAVMAQIELISGLAALKANPMAQGCVATIGAFDGVHLGHQQLLKYIKAHAERLQLPSVVVVFEPQPNEFFNKHSAPSRLMRLREKVLAIQAQGIDKVVCLRFNQALRTLSAEQFVRSVLVNALAARYIVVGDDFRFGCDRKGDFTFLQAAGQRFGFTVSDTQTHTMHHERVSSTRIRKLLHSGDLVGAQNLLDRPYSNLGRVKFGKQLGRTLGFPTANIDLGRLSVPLQGVFAVKVSRRCGASVDTLQGVANVGVRPTVDGTGKPILEVHLFDVDTSLYGEFLHVEYVKKIRDEIRFSSIEALKTQIEHDVKSAKEIFSKQVK